MDEVEIDATLRIVLEGDLGDIPVEALIRTLEQTVGILNQLDVTTVGRSTPSLVWYVTGLAEGSATIEVVGRPKPTKRPQRRRIVADPNEVARTFVAGLDSLQTSDRVPERFAEQSVRRVGTIGRILEGGPDRLVVVGPPPADPDDIRPRSAHVSEVAARHSNQAGRVATRTRTSVIGRLERVDLHRRNRFGVYNSRSNRPIMCDFAGDELRTVVGAIGHRVLVDGILSRNAAGDPLRIEVDQIEVLRDDAELPTIADVYRSDPDFTGGHTVNEFVRHLREAQ